MNQQIAEAVSEVATAVRAGEVNRTGALVMLSDRMYPIEEQNPEVLDAVTRDAIMSELNPVLHEAGFSPMVPWEF